MSAVGVAPADVTIAPDVRRFDMSEFTSAIELATVGEQQRSNVCRRSRRCFNAWTRGCSGLTDNVSLSRQDEWGRGEVRSEGSHERLSITDFFHTTAV
jgi:hypothetical protein